MSSDLGTHAESAIDVLSMHRAGPSFLGRRVKAPSAPRRRVFLNGKFYVGVVNGVHRTADRLVRELDALKGGGEQHDVDIRLLLPAKPNWAPPLTNIEKVPQTLGHSQVWEQFILPINAADGVLVNLANLAPVLHRRKISMIHDAQFLISPESFPLRFRLGYRVLTPLIASSSERVLTVSEYARDSLAAFHVARHASTDVIYNGADHILEVSPDRRIFDKLRLRKNYAIVFGNTAVYKNVQVVFEAFRQLDVGVQLVVLGASRRAFLDAEMEPPHDAVFAGQVSDGELRALYETAVCLLFPSRTEGFGLPPVEAMACGCPVIAAPAGAIPEVCRDAILYADIFSPGDWSDHVRTLRTRPDIRATKVEAGRRRSARFTWRAAGQCLLDCILEVASG